MKDALVPLLRYVVAALVGLFATWAADTLGLEVTHDNQAFLTETLTTLGVFLFGIVAAAASRWLKPRFLRGWHPGGQEGDYVTGYIWGKRWIRKQS